MFYSRLVTFILIALVGHVKAQTYSRCNPLYEVCDPNPGLGRSIYMDFAGHGPSNSMIRTGSTTVAYDPSEGAIFTIYGPGHNPTLESKFYIMFGKVTVVAKAAEGAGIVSSIVLQSDDLDEIDFEFVGNDAPRVQTNYFSKGDTSTYDRGKYHRVPGKSATEDFHVYTIEWTADSIKWHVDGNLARSLHAASAPEKFPQTPMCLKVGSWTAGDTSLNQEGTIEWAGGPIDYAEAPFTFAVKSIEVEDYSTGTNYEYTDNSGSWTSIKAHNGVVGASGPASQTWFKNMMKVAKPL